MGGFWGGLVVGFGVGSMFGALIVGTIWARHFLRTYKEQVKRSERSEAREARLLAITEILNKDQIRALAPEIEKTQRLIRARPSDS